MVRPVTVSVSGAIRTPGRDRDPDRLRPLLHGRQDLTAQRQTLLGLGVAEDCIYLDHGLTGTNRARPGLDQAFAAVRAGDTPKLTPIFAALLSRWGRGVMLVADVLGALCRKGLLGRGSPVRPALGVISLTPT